MCGAAQGPRCSRSARFVSSFPTQSSTTDRFTYHSFWKALKSRRPRAEREGMGQKGFFFFLGIQ